MKVKRLICIMSAVFCLFFLGGMTVNAAEPLDEIQNYTITVHMRPDGTMDIRYYIEWKVLNDESEGPLTWVKIGNPNKHVDEITAISSNIKDIKYMSENGSYIRVDFDKKYYKNDIVTFEYTIHQSYMYIIEKDSNICRYSFTPGWFDEIEVKNITIKWSDENVLESTCHEHKDGYLIWESSLDVGERLNASVKYNLDTFTTNEDQQYTEDSGESNGKAVLIAVLIIIGIIIIVAFVIFIFSDDDYHGGFGGRSSTYIHTHSSCARSSCACVSSCACACACAGGGRAGCSKKDFYKTNVKTEELKEILK